MNWRLLTVAAALLVLAGCAGVRGVAPSGPANEAAWQSRRARLMQLTDWEMQGRVGMSNGSDGGSGSMDWLQHGEQLQFDFRGPFGSGALDIKGDGKALHVKSSRGDDFVTSNPERDFMRLLHVPLPVLRMRYWVVGLPAPKAAFTRQIGAQGQLEQLAQLGWQISYFAYANFDGHDLPTRLLIQRGKVRIKLVIDQWRFGDSSGPQVSAP